MNERLTPWDRIGAPVIEGGDNIKSTLKDVGMDWKVIPRKVYIPDGYYDEPGVMTMDNMFSPNNYIANVRGDTGDLLGIVSDKYSIVQNEEAFSFIDYMIPEGLKIIKGGIIGGKKVWLVGQFGRPFSIGGDNDDTTLYLVFTNSHDGKGSVRVCITPVRVACQNTLSLAFANSIRSWSISHVGDVQGKLHTAEQTMIMAADYAVRFQDTGLILKDKTLTKERTQELLESLFPLPTGSSPQKEKSVLERRALVNNIYTNAPDLGRNTAWDFVNAVSDYTTHYIPSYDEKLYRNSVFNKIIKGHPLIDKAYKLVA